MANVIPDNYPCEICNTQLAKVLLKNDKAVCYDCEEEWSAEFLSKHKSIKELIAMTYIELRRMNDKLDSVSKYLDLKQCND